MPMDRATDWRMHMTTGVVTRVIITKVSPKLLENITPLKLARYTKKMNTPMAKASSILTTMVRVESGVMDMLDRSSLLMGGSPFLR